jgi:phospho-N-acetylmuramoyl-pentapeptide-transferase
MLYYLLYPLAKEHILFNVFKYITFRTFCALLTAMAIYFFFGLRWIEFLKKKQFGQIIRSDGPQSHLQKKNTPTMGGVLIVASLLTATLLWADLTNPFVWVAILVLVSFSAIGLMDDIKKVIHKDPLGFRGQYKIILEVLVCLAAGLYLYGDMHLDTRLHVPFFKTVTPDIGVFYLYLTFLVVAGTANAVNLTDGLDGLVTIPAVSAFLSYAILAYAASNMVISSYLQVAEVPGAGELTVLCGAAIGALIGFLWYNTHPAEIFMGDVGALGIGSLLGAVALMTKNEILLILIGGIFVLETASVITQVVSFKLTGKRVFRMAPIHHHFELKGWQESKVIVRFWIISFILSLLALATLKLR